MKLTVIIPTYNRPDCIARNLAALAVQQPRPEQVIIVDASGDHRTEAVVRGVDRVRYIRSTIGRGNIPAARNLALAEATGDVIAFLDDDAFAHPGWAAALAESYQDPTVAGVAGRALNGVPGEEVDGVDAIGKFTASGKVIGHFGADPGRTIEVDHQIGCNMSFRASLLAELGGFRDDFRTGPFGICEESDLCVRAKRLGARFVFNPLAAADHVGAKQVGGKRFSPKYSYYHARNNLVMVIRNYGPGGMAVRNVFAVGGFFARDFTRKFLGAAAHLAFGFAGLLVGFVLGLYWLLRTGFSPTRRDRAADALRRQLAPTSSATAKPADVEPSRAVLEASV